jgi:hypothetical protein
MDFLHLAPSILQIGPYSLACCLIWIPHKPTNPEAWICFLPFSFLFLFFFKEKHLLRSIIRLSFLDFFFFLVSLSGLSNTNGLHQFKDRKGSQMASAVQALVDAGAIPIAVTNVPEGCIGWETVNGVYGYTYNPHDLRRTPGGSSGGEVRTLT